MIVVCPYSILLNEQCQKVKDAGLKVVSYKLDKKPPEETQILFVQVEHAQKSTFERFLLNGEAAKFTHMIINEQHIHIICAKDRKDAWTRLARCASLVNMPVILLSATNPPGLQGQMLINFGLHEDCTALIRRPTNRAELGLHVIWLNSLTESRALQHLVYVLLGKLQTSERMLVFFEHCDLAENFVKQNKFAVYHSKLPGAAVKSENLRSWDSRETKVMACTSAFGFGVDRPNIRFVVIFNPEFSLLMTMQMVGRARRDGREAHVFFAMSQQLSSFQKNDTSFTLELGQLMHLPICRVYQAMLSMDGAKMAQKCMELQGQVPCDVCQPNSKLHIFAKDVVQDPKREFVKPGARPGERSSVSTTKNVGGGLLEQMVAHTSEPWASEDNKVKLRELAAKVTFLGDQHRIWLGEKFASQPNPIARPQPEMQFMSAPSRLHPYFSTRSMDVNAATRARKNSTTDLDRYMPLLKGKCPYHFVLTGRLEMDHCPCLLEAELSEDFHPFKKSFSFGKYTYCYTCGMPQDKDHNGKGPMCHSKHQWTARKPCVIVPFIFKVTFGIWQREHLWWEMIKGLGVTESINELEEFTEWAKREDRLEGKYHNCLEVFLWFCHRKEQANPKYFFG